MDPPAAILLSSMTASRPDIGLTAPAAVAFSVGTLLSPQVATVLNFDDGKPKPPGVLGSGFMRSWDDAMLSDRLPGRSLIQMSLGSERSSSLYLPEEPRKRFADVMVSDLSMVISPVPRAPATGRAGATLLLLLAPRCRKQGRQPRVEAPRHCGGMSCLAAAASFCREDAVVPNTTKMKMPGVVPGMKRKSVCVARAALRSGALALVSLMLLFSAVIWN